MESRGSRTDESKLTPTSLDELARSMTELYKPLDVAHVNEATLTMSCLQGEFPWHEHEEDEMFFCWRGSVTIALPDGEVTLRPGELYVIPKRTQHRPRADEVTYVLHLEAKSGRLYKNRHASPASRPDSVS